MNPNAQLALNLLIFHALEGLKKKREITNTNGKNFEYQKFRVEKMVNIPNKQSLRGTKRSKKSEIHP